MEFPRHYRSLGRYHRSKNEYNIDLKQLNDIKNVDCLVLAVAHDEFKIMNLLDMDNLFKPLPNSEKVFIDLKISVLYLSLHLLVIILEIIK